MQPIKTVFWLKNIPSPLVVDFATRQEFDQIVDSWKIARTAGRSTILEGTSYIGNDPWHWKFHTDDVVAIHTMVVAPPQVGMQPHVAPGVQPPWWGGSGHRN